MNIENQGNQFFGAVKLPTGSDIPKKPEEKKKDRLSRKNFFVETDEACSYLGVEVEKGEGGVMVPDKRAFEDYAYTEDDYILMREIATALKLNQPLLVEGGTGIGKTSAVKRMSADLNLNYCLVSFSESTDLMDVIGHKDINIEGGKETIRWYDGKLIEAIRYGGVAFLDEYNFQGGKIGGRINPIIDSILNGDKKIILPENNNEIIEVHPNFRLIAAQNPPGTEDGQEFTGRDNLSAEKFNRWTFHKLPNRMDPKMEEKRMAGMMGEEIEVEIPESEFRSGGEEIPLSELKNIPGMKHWREKFIEIKTTLEAKVADRTMGRQAQKIYFGPRLGQKILRYVAAFYRGDVNETWENALEYYIVKMFKGEAEREKIREIINMSVYNPPVAESKRKGLEPEGEDTEKQDLLDKIKEAKAGIPDWLLPETKSSPESLSGAGAITAWLKENGLEEKLEGGSFEGLIERQEEFYQEVYGKDFKIDRSKIIIEKDRLPRIKKGLENGSANFPLIISTPEKLSEKEKNQTEAEYAYHKFLEPLKKESLKIWAEEGTDRWTGLTLAEVLKGYIPVEASDFDPEELEKDWIKEIQRVIKEKGPAPKIKPGKIELIFTDSRQDVPKEQMAVNEDAEEVENKFSLIEMIKNKVKALTPLQWMLLAAMKHKDDKNYLSRNTFDWLMAVVDHEGKKTDPPVSVACANLGDDGVSLDSDDASSDDGGLRWRCAH